MCLCFLYSPLSGQIAADYMLVMNEAELNVGWI